MVRHGQTGGNIAHRHQHEDTPLTKLGQEQAREAAELIQRFEPTHILSSSLVRTIETANSIGEVCDIVPETSYHFIELRRPKNVYGHYHRSLRSVWYFVTWYLGLVRDGESYAEVRLRIKAAQRLLSTYPADARVVVVTHSVFLNLFLAHMCDERPMWPLSAVKTFVRILKTKNTQISKILYDPQEREGVCQWSLYK